jgi:hypothetical protein
MAKRRKKPTPIPNESGLELGFLRTWSLTVPALLPSPVREYVFTGGRRGWRFDFAWPGLLLAVELHGAQWKPGGGRHQRGHGFRRDCEKMNDAQLAGWTVLQYTTDHMEKMPMQVVEEVAKEVAERCKEEFGT